MKTPEWKPIGECAMDTAGLLIADPCYVIHQEGRDPKTLEIHDYNQWVASKDEVTNLRFKRGHEGAGVIVHSPNGDGCVTVWGKIDEQGCVRAVYFSFDGKPPK
jgi:hypothetical protein